MRHAVRLIVLAATATTALVVASPGVAGAASKTESFHFKGHAAEAVLTNCPQAGPADCSAVDVFGFEQRITGNVPHMTGTGVSVIQFAVHVFADGSFNAVQIAAGGTGGATFDVRGRLASARLHAVVPMQSCDAQLVCEGPPVPTVVDVTWSGSGSIDRTGEKVVGHHPFLHIIDAQQIRFADAVGTFGGVAMEDIPDLFPATIERDAFGSVSRP